MQFWDGLKQVVDNYVSPFQVQLSASFGAQSSQSYKGTVRAMFYKDQVTLVPGNSVLPQIQGALDLGLGSVFWLPWSNQSITKVMLTDLNSSGCNYFMTSEFSGCRFVITNEYIAHVAHWAKAGGNNMVPLFRRSQVRTEAELSGRERAGMQKPTLYRAISSSNLTNSAASGFGSNDSQTLSYFQGGIDVDRMLIFGYRDTNSIIGWSFKYLTFTANQMTKPIWHEVPLPAARSSLSN